MGGGQAELGDSSGTHTLSSASPELPSPSGMKLSPPHPSFISFFVAWLRLYGSALFLIRPLTPRGSSPGWPVNHVINGRHLITLSSRMTKFIRHLSYELFFFI